MKSIFGIGGIIIVGIVAFVLWSPTPAITPTHDTVSDQVHTETHVKEGLVSGVYVVNPNMSTLQWSGKKPLIEGYVNAGAITIQSGEVVVGDSQHSAEFVIDMNTLSVSGTPAKPGRESALEEHLKGERWFNISEYPTAMFAIRSIVPREESAEKNLYDVTGELTMKGETGQLTFPAKIYMSEDGSLHAIADLEFDRTQWGITAGSGSFFDNLADNVIDDMVSLSFHLVAEKK